MIINIKIKTFEEIKRDKPREFRIFKPLKELDAEIRILREEINEDRNEVYYILEVGYYESIGERGLINQFHYDDIPTEEEIKKDIKEDLINDMKNYKESLAISGTEEEYLKILKRLNLKW